MNKRSLYIIIFIFCSVFVFAGGKKETPLVKFTGSIDYIDGSVVINNTRAELKSIVKDGDIIKTGDNSFCDIIFNKGNIFRMSSDTIIQINWSKNSLNLEQGSIASVFKKLDSVLGPNDKFKIITHTATAGIRGTAFYIKVEDNSDTYICTCNGSLELYRDGAPGFISSATHHKAFRFSRSGDVVTVKPATLLYHDDNLMDEVALEIGSKIPWK